MSNTVDLSLAKPGDECHQRDGLSDSFVGPVDGNDGYEPEYEFRVGDNVYCRDGRFFRFSSDNGNDIVRVTRNGVQITPAIGGSERERQPNAYTTVTPDPLTPQEARGLALEILERNEDAREESAAPGAVITGPGKYRTELFDKTGATGDLARVECVGIQFSDRIERALGVFHDEPEGWHMQDGFPFFNGDSAITGRYVEPPEPVSENDLKWLATFLYGQVIRLNPDSLNEGERFRDAMLRAQGLVARVNNTATA